MSRNRPSYNANRSFSDSQQSWPRLIRNFKHERAIAELIGESGVLTAGGAMATGFSVLGDLMNEKGRGDPARVATRAAKAGGEAMARGAATRVVQAGLKEAAKVSGKQGIKAVARGNPFFTVASLIVDQGVDSARLATGKIDGDEYAKRTVENVGGAGGGAGGAAAGAMVGSMILPGVGTLIGGFIGGILGGAGGRTAASSIVRE